MLKVLFYSYKGGSGRTTAMANVAAILAERHRVVCLDMDIEGPGLSVLFEAEPKNKEGRVYLQDYLQDPAGFNLDNALIDISERKKNWPIDSGRLLFLPADVGFEKPVNYTGERPRELLGGLFETISAKVNPDYVLMDSPSGYGDMSALSMVFADKLLLFFRWSRQHLIGSIKIAQFIRVLDIELTPVASCVPQPEDPIMARYREVLEEGMERQVGCSLVEDLRMKWKDEVVVFGRPEDDPLVRGYHQLAELVKGGEI